jgi:L-alanine-DL-glutamate epimerase-like enolase superfamily enzyme
MNHDLSFYLTSAEDADVSFKGKYPCAFFVSDVPVKLPVWHLVGGTDLLTKAELTGNEPQDGYPVVLEDWLETDGLNCLKIKLCGNDKEADYQRLVAVGKIAASYDVDWLSTDFNCMVTEPTYVNEILDRLVLENPDVFRRILYVEQPFPYDLENNQIDVHSVSDRKPLFMDESAHDWKFVKLGRKLGWTGVALKVCKTQTGALLSMCWAKAHGMTLMVQDLTNPMLAIVPHVLLAAYSGTIMGVECNAAQFYPAASKAEGKIHPRLYERRNGVVDFSTLKGSGFGYREDEISRELPLATCKY